MISSAHAQFRLHTVAFVAITLVACGGGAGGDSGGAPAVQTAPLNSTNARQAASDAKGAMDAASDGGVQDYGVFSVNSANAGGFSLARFVKKYLADVSARQSAGPMFSPQLVENCLSSGSYSYEWYDNGDGFDSTGDFYAFSFSNCDDGGITLNGQLSISNFQVTGDPASSNYSLSASTTYSLTITEGSEVSTINGTVNLTISEAGGLLTMAISGPALTVTEGGETMNLSGFSMTFTENALGAYTVSFDGTTSSTDLGGAIVVDTTLEFSGTGVGEPTSGSMTLYGAYGSRVVVTAIGGVGGGSVRLDVDADGNGVFDGAPLITTWSELAML